MITRFSVRNFKSLRDVSVDLDPVTVLIGRSGTGKTNFVNAVSFLRSFLSNRSADGEVNKLGGWKKVLFGSERNDAPLGFDVVFSIASFSSDFMYSVEFAEQHGGRQITKELLTYADEALFEARNGRWVVEPKSGVTLNANQSMLGAISGIPEISIAHKALTVGIGCYEISPSALAGRGTERPTLPGLADDGSNFLTVFRGIEENLESLDRWRNLIECMRQLNPSLNNIEIEKPDASRVAVSYKIGERVLTLELAQESQGFHRLLAHLIALYQSPPKQTLFVEEPELGIHPGALGVLADQFKLSPVSGRGQVVLTTHSPELLNYFSPENVRVVKIKDHETHVGRLAEDQVENVRDHLYSLGEVLTADPARMAGSNETVSTVL